MDFDTIELQQMDNCCGGNVGGSISAVGHGTGQVGQVQRTPMPEMPDTPDTIGLRLKAAALAVAESGVAVGVDRSGSGIGIGIGIGSSSEDGSDNGSGSRHRKPPAAAVAVAKVEVAEADADTCAEVGLLPAAFAHSSTVGGWGNGGSQCGGSTNATVNTCNRLWRGLEPPVDALPDALAAR